MILKIDSHSVTNTKSICFFGINNTRTFSNTVLPSFMFLSKGWTFGALSQQPYRLGLCKSLINIGFQKIISLYAGNRTDYINKYKVYLFGGLEEYYYKSDK